MSRRDLLKALPLLACVACASAPPQSPVQVPAGMAGVAYPGAYSAKTDQRYLAQPPTLGQPIRPPAAAMPAAKFGEADAGLQGMAEGETERAEQSFERALEVNPFDPVALNNLAVAKAEQGQFHEATAMLERAAKLQPDNAEIAANLARLRGYVQGYAMAGVEPAGQSPAAISGNLPPAPPALWGSNRASQPAGFGRAVVVDEAGMVARAPVTSGGGGSSATAGSFVASDSAGGYYISEACREPGASAPAKKKTKPKTVTRSGPGSGCSTPAP